MGTAIFSRNIKTIKTRQISTLVVDSINTQINGFATIWDEGYEYINMDTLRIQIYICVYIHYKEIWLSLRGRNGSFAEMTFGLVFEVLRVN